MFRRCGSNRYRAVWHALVHLNRGCSSVLVVWCSALRSRECRSVSEFAAAKLRKLDYIHFPLTRENFNPSHKVTITGKPVPTIFSRKIAPTVHTVMATRRLYNREREREL